MLKYAIDFNGETKDFPKYWQMCVGSGHAALGLRADWQQHLKYIRDELGFKYVRFHGLLNDDMKIITKLSDMIPIPGADKVQTYSFYQIGILFDYILSIGMKPFLELGFMPTALASGKKAVFFYKGNITPPKDYDKWKDLIIKLAEFLIDRYGEEEVASWYFEVWNEPDLKNIFWKGTQGDYFKLYKETALALKSVSKRIPVGGPSTSGNRWLKELQIFCRENMVPLDFLSTHHYPGVALGHDVSGFKKIREIFSKVKDAQNGDVHSFFRSFISQEKELKNAPRGILTKQVRKAREEVGDLPLIYTEWNSNSGCSYFQNDEPYTSAFIVKTIIDNQGSVDGYSFWTFSDLFEELSFFHKPFSGSFGMLNIHGIPKPSFWAFKLLSKLGDQKLDTSSLTGSETVEIFVFTKEDELQILLFNQQMPGNPIVEEDVNLSIKGIDQIEELTIERVDENHGHPKKIWSEMGEPEYLSSEMVQSIKNKSRVVPEKFPYDSAGEELKLKVHIPAQGIALIHIKV